MATVTTTQSRHANDNGKTAHVSARPNDHHTGTQKARYIGPPPVDEHGKTIPHTKRWGYSTDVFTNDEMKSTGFVIALMAAFTAWNQTQTAFNLYDWMYRNFTPFQVSFFATYIVTFTVYFGIAAIFAFVDLTGKPRFLFKYKVQPFQRVDGREYRHITAIALRNFTVVVIPLIFVKAKLTPARIDPRTLEGPALTMVNLLINLFLTEVGFYLIHRFFHTPWMYARFHKQHHYMTAPVAIASTYCTMTEHIFSNLLPNSIGTSLLKPHWSVQTATFCILSTTTLCAHSGYNIPYLYSSLQHDWHHMAFNENYGPTGLLDAFFGTSRRFQSVLREGLERHAGRPDLARKELISKLAAWEATSQPASKSRTNAFLKDSANLGDAESSGSDD